MTIMATRRTINNLKFRRRREAKTRYKKRVALVTGGFDRLVVRKTNRIIIGQVVRYNEKGDVTLARADSRELAKMNWPGRANRATAYLTGMLLAKKLKDKSECILDIGLNSPVKNAIPFVFAKGCVDAGMKVRGDFKIDENVYDYSRIAKYAKELNGSKKSQFAAYTKANVKLDEMPKMFAAVRDKIKSMN